jgi:cold-inducible RNA-binding protein
LYASFLIDPESIQRVEELCQKGNLVGKQLYVGNLTDSVSSTELLDWFTPFGTVQSAQVVTDRDTGDSKGFGFVEMDTDPQAQAAIQGLNDIEYEGRWLIVSEAKPRVARTTGFAGGRLEGSARTGGGDGYGGSGGGSYGLQRKPLSSRP